MVVALCNLFQMANKGASQTFKYFPETRYVIDCTEFYVQKPSVPTSQRRTWSTYKSHNTFKAHVSTTLRGSFSFISPLWRCNASDSKMVQNSGYLEKLERDDDIMADRGFLVRDLLALRGATLNMPTFTHGRQIVKVQGLQLYNVQCSVAHRMGDIAPSRMNSFVYIHVHR